MNRYQTCVISDVCVWKKTRSHCHFSTGDGRFLETITVKVSVLLLLPSEKHNSLEGALCSRLSSVATAVWWYYMSTARYSGEAFLLVSPSLPPSLSLPAPLPTLSLMCTLARSHEKLNYSHASKALTTCHATLHQKVRKKQVIVIRGSSQNRKCQNITFNNRCLLATVLMLWLCCHAVWQKKQQLKNKKKRRQMGGASCCFWLCSQQLDCFLLFFVVSWHEDKLHVLL